MAEIALALTTARIAYVDGEGRMQYATPGVGRAAGAPVDRLLGKGIAEMDEMRPVRDALDDIQREVLSTREAVRRIVTIGEGADLVSAEYTAVPVLGPDGAVDGAVITAWDISELTRAWRRIAALDRTRAMLSDINQAIVRVRERQVLLDEACGIAAGVGGLPLAWIGFVNPDGDIAVAASAGSAVRILDQVTVSARNDPAGSGPAGASVRENRPVVLDKVMELWREQWQAHGLRSAAAFPLRHADRAIGCFVLCSTESHFFDTEEVRLFEELAGDISFALDSIEAERGRTAAEEALRGSEERYRYLFERNPQAMWVFDVETFRFLAVNDAAVDTYGYARDEFLAMTIKDIRPEEDVPALLNEVATVAPELRSRGTWRHRRKDGELMDVEVSSHDFDYGGRKSRLVSVIDVTERRRLEARMAESARMEAMGHLAGGIAHDFNNLLTVVNGYADMLVAELGDSPLAEDAREIRRAGARAAELTRQVLAFARRQVMEARPVDANAAVGAVSQMLRRLIGEQVRLITNLDCRPAVVMADPGQLDQVLVNLAINARDAMPDGGDLTIGVICLDRAEDFEHGLSGPAVLLTVADTGMGMDATTLTRAFEPFFTTKQTGAGTGLGLATVDGIVHQSHGEIWAESTVGHGTTIFVLLPQAAERAEPEAAPVEAAAGRTRKATILVAEDEAAVRAFVVAALERAGHRVLVAGSAAEAEALTRGLSERIDVLLTDLVMPDWSGQLLAQRLVTARPDLRVITMSGYGDGLTGAHAGAVPAGFGPVTPDGSTRFLAKPFSREELTAMVDAIMAEAPDTGE
jgi:hypothetical protein